MCKLQSFRLFSLAEFGVGLRKMTSSSWPAQTVTFSSSDLRFGCYLLCHHNASKTQRNLYFPSSRFHSGWPMLSDELDSKPEVNLWLRFPDSDWPALTKSGFCSASRPLQLLVQFVQNASIRLVQSLEESESKHPCLPPLAPAQGPLCAPLELTGQHRSAAEPPREDLHRAPTVTGPLNWSTADRSVGADGPEGDRHMQGSHPVYLVVSRLPAETFQSDCGPPFILLTFWNSIYIQRKSKFSRL